MPRRIVLMMFSLPLLRSPQTHRTQPARLRPGKHSSLLVRHRQRQYCEWDFFCTSGRGQGTWTRIPVRPAGSSRALRLQLWTRSYFRSEPAGARAGKVSYAVRCSAGWKGKIVRLVFEGSMTDTEVWINGQSAGPTIKVHSIAYKYDITPLLKFGEANLLEATVSKVSANESVNNAERFNVDYWVFGGIFRPVYLEALPQRFIDWTAIDPRADGSLSIEAHLGGDVKTRAR